MIALNCTIYNLVKCYFCPTILGINMSAIKNQPKKSKSGYRSLLIVSGILAAIGISLFAYLMFYTAPAEELEKVQVIAVTEQGCVAETIDGFAVNIGQCSAEKGEYTYALVDQKVKERAAAMNPTD